MAWTVAIQTESGRSAGRDFDIPFEAIPSGPEYPICNSVARYYVTILNPPQLEAFVSEWDKASSTREFSQLRQHVILRDTAERCVRQQLYQRFVGD